MSRLRLIIALFVAVVALVPLSAYAQENTDEDELVFRINGDQRIESGASVALAGVINGNATVAGSVTEVLVVVSGDIEIADGGTVDGAIWLVDGELCVQPGGTVSADIYLSDDAFVDPECPGAITGEIFTESFDIDLSSDFAIFLTIFYLSSWFGMTLLTIIVAFVFAGAGGKQLWDTTSNMTGKLWQSLVTGFVVWLATPVLFGVLLVTVFGAPIAVLIAATASLLWFFGYIVAGTRIGATLTGRSTAVREHHPYLPAIVGALVLQLVMLVATAGLLIVAVGLLFAGDSQAFFVVLGLPVAFIWAVLWIAGMWGAGALVYTAIRAWRSPAGEAIDDGAAPVDAQPQPAAPAVDPRAPVEENLEDPAAESEAPDMDEQSTSSAASQVEPERPATEPQPPAEQEPADQAAESGEPDEDERSEPEE